MGLDAFVPRRHDQHQWIAPDLELLLQLAVAPAFLRRQHACVFRKIKYDALEFICGIVEKCALREDFLLQLLAISAPVATGEKQEQIAPVRFRPLPRRIVVHRKTRRQFAIGIRLRLLRHRNSNADRRKAISLAICRRHRLPVGVVAEIVTERVFLVAERDEPRVVADRPHTFRRIREHRADAFHVFLAVALVDALELHAQLLSRLVFLVIALRLKPLASIHPRAAHHPGELAIGKFFYRHAGENQRRLPFPHRNIPGVRFCANFGRRRLCRFFFRLFVRFLLLNWLQTFRSRHRLFRKKRLGVVRHFAAEESANLVIGRRPDECLQFLLDLLVLLGNRQRRPLRRALRQIDCRLLRKRERPSLDDAPRRLPVARREEIPPHEIEMPRSKRLGIFADNFGQRLAIKTGVDSALQPARLRRLLCSQPFVLPLRRYLHHAKIES